MDSCPPFTDLQSMHMANLEQPWWKTDNYSSLEEYPSKETRIYGDFPPYGNGLSTISDSQSPRSSNGSGMPTINYYASSPFPNDDSIVFDNPMLYPMPDDSYVESSLALLEPNLFDAQPGRRSPLEELSPSLYNHTDRNNPILQTVWTSPLHQDNTPLAPRLKSRATSTSRARKSTEKRASSGLRRRGHRAASGLSSDGPRIFVCSFAPYGCESTFVSKNEWKRHVNSQHLLLGFYRCDVGKCKTSSQHSNGFMLIPCNTSHSHTMPQPGLPNDFNRKDLFTQHHRRMHAPWRQYGRRTVPTENERGAFEDTLEEVRRRCWQSLRQPPLQSHCGFCKETFSGIGSWDVRMEHVGRHFERDDPASLGKVKEDVALREWGLNEGILALVDGRCKLASLAVGSGFECGAQKWNEFWTCVDTRNLADPKFKMKC